MNILLVSYENNIFCLFDKRLTYKQKIKLNLWCLSIYAIILVKVIFKKKLKNYELR